MCRVEDGSNRLSRVVNNGEGILVMGDHLTTVATFLDPIAAALARNYLDSHGIPAVLIDETTIATDWMLGGAIGGIKLQVSPFHIECAELLLAQIRERQQDNEAEPPVPENAIASQEVAEELQQEREDKAEVNQLTDRMFRSTVFGLIPVLFWAQLYALYLLVVIWRAKEEVSPNRRWKIWASLALNVPLVGSILMLLACVLGAFSGPPGTPDNPRWAWHRFPERELRIRFPHEPWHKRGRPENPPWNQATFVQWYAVVGNRAHYELILIDRPADLVQAPAEEALAAIAGEPVAEWKLIVDRPIRHRDMPGREVIRDRGVFRDRWRVFERGRELICVGAFVVAGDETNEEVNAYFESLQFR